jgi:hypothetical protein
MKKIIAIVCLASSTNLTRADVLADWTFETSQPNIPSPGAAAAGSYAAESGINANSSFATGNHADATTVWSSPAGNGSPHSFSSSKWTSEDYYQFATSTVGYNTITLSWSQTSSSTGPTAFTLRYSIDGSTYVDVAGAGSVDGSSISGNSYTVGTTSWSSGSASSHTLVSFDLSSMSQVNNDNALYFRLVTSSATTSGTDRVDDFVINGNLIPVPEPAEWGAVSGLGLLGICGLRIWRQQRASRIPV